jgi:hypothetical protein
MSHTVDKRKIQKDTRRFFWKFWILLVFVFKYFFKIFISDYFLVGEMRGEIVVYKSSSSIHTHVEKEKKETKKELVLAALGSRHVAMKTSIQIFRFFFLSRQLSLFFSFSSSSLVTTFSSSFVRFFCSPSVCPLPDEPLIHRLLMTDWHC